MVFLATPLASRYEVVYNPAMKKNKVISEYFKELQKRSHKSQKEMYGGEEGYKLEMARRAALSYSKKKKVNED